MGIKESYELFRIASKPYGFEILNFIYNSPKRFTDLKKICPNDKTLTIRLNDLKEARLITTRIEKIKDRDFIHYVLTETGVSILQSVQDYEAMHKVLMEERRK